MKPAWPPSLPLSTRPNGEWGFSTRRPMLEPERPEAVLPERALCLPTFSHLLIVNELLSHSLLAPSVHLIHRFRFRFCFEQISCCNNARTIRTIRVTSFVTSFVTSPSDLAQFRVCLRVCCVVLIESESEREGELHEELSRTFHPKAP